MLVRSASLVFASIAALLLLAATAGCTGGGEPEATATASGTAEATDAPEPAATATPAATAAATATPKPPLPVDISSGQHTLTEGAYRYSTPPGVSPAARLHFTVPAGLRLLVGELIRSKRFGDPVIGLVLEDTESRSRITIDLRSGRVWHRLIDDKAGRGLDQLFEKLVESVRAPWPTPDPVPVGTAESPLDISGWQFTRRTLGEGVYSFRLNPGAQLLTFAVPAGPRFEARFDARMHEPFAGWCPGLLLVERWNDSELCLDVHRAVELARGERDSAIGRLFDSIAASLRLGPPSDDASARCAPLIDATYYYSILTGGNTYLLRRSDPPTFVSFHVPAGVTISSVSEGSLDGLQTSGTLDLREATSGSRLVIDLATGNEHERELLPVPPPYDLDVGAAFDQIAASFRLDWPLPDLGCAVTSLLIRGQTIGGGTYRVRVNPDYADGLLALAFDVPEGLTVRIDWEEDEYLMIRLTDAETGAWLCLRLGLVEECRRWIPRDAQHLRPLFDQVSESLRSGWTGR